MDKYGWYTEGDEIIGGSGDDVADLIHDAVADFAAGEKEGTFCSGGCWCEVGTRPLASRCG